MTRSSCGQLGPLATAALCLSLAAPALAAEVDRRQENQQDRIAQGANGGQLTPAERAQVNRQQNRVSNRIYRAKHDDRHL